MRLTIYQAQHGAWRALRFACSRCNFVGVVRAFGMARAAGMFARFADASAADDAAIDASRIAAAATCPKCGRHDEAALRRYYARAKQLGVLALVLAAGGALLAAGLGLVAVLAIALGLALFGNDLASRRRLPPIGDRISFVDAGVPEPAPRHALFLCATCHEPAGSLSVHGDRLELRGFVEDVDDVLDDGDRASTAAAGVAANRVRALWERDPAWAPFYCADCDACYCSAHWDMTARTEASPPRDEPYRGVGELGELESIAGRCPNKHERDLTPP